MTFGLYFKGNNEAITKKNFFSEEEAVIFYSNLKQITIDEFLKIFEVKII